MVTFVARDTNGCASDRIIVETPYRKTFAVLLHGTGATPQE